MRIDNSYLTSLGRSEISASTEAGQTAQPEETKPGKTAQPPDHVRAPELYKLRELMLLVPEIRTDEMARVAQFIQNGHYFTREIAVQTADSIIQAIE